MKNISEQENLDHTFVLQNDPTNTPVDPSSDHDNYFRDSWAFDTNEEIPYWTWVKAKFLENN